MITSVWAELSAKDVALIVEAVSALRLAEPDRADEIDRLEMGLASAASPEITIGVYGGVVQWVQGNPYPIRIVDYDGEDDKLPDRDDEGLPCSLWHADRDPELATAQGGTDRSR